MHRNNQNIRLGKRVVLMSFHLWNWSCWILLLVLELGTDWSTRILQYMRWLKRKSYSYLTESATIIELDPFMHEWFIFLKYVNMSFILSSCVEYISMAKSYINIDTVCFVTRVYKIMLHKTNHSSKCYALGLLLLQIGLLCHPRSR